MNRSRIALGLVAASCGVASVWSAYQTAREVAEFHREHPPQVFAFLPVGHTAFKFGGRDVTLTEDRATPDSPWIDVRYGEASQRIRVTIPSRHQLPALLGQDDWMRVMFFAPMSGRTMPEFRKGVEDGSIETRLVIATRTPPPGTDPTTWGAVRKADWTFDFYELRPDGSIDHEHLKYPTTRGMKAPKPGELHENTWEFQAALMLMPQAGGVGPTRNFFGDALVAAGWYLPVACFTGLAATIIGAFTIAPRRRGSGASWRTGVSGTPSPLPR